MRRKIVITLSLFLVVLAVTLLYVRYEFKQLSIRECEMWEKQGKRALDFMWDYKKSECKKVNIEL